MRPFHGKEGQMAGPLSLMVCSAWLRTSNAWHQPATEALIISNTPLGLYMDEDVCEVKGSPCLLSQNHHNECGQRDMGRGPDEGIGDVRCCEVLKIKQTTAAATAASPAIYWVPVLCWVHHIHLSV